MSTASQTSEYLKSAERWEEEIYQTRVGALKIWRLAAILFALLSFLLAAALVLMLPLKEFQPYVVTVDEQTGRATATLVAQSGPLTQDEAVVRSLIGQYVIQRETYDSYDNGPRISTVAQLSVGEALASLRQTWARGNPDHPSEVFGRNRKIVVEIANISMLNNRTASVQYAKHLIQGGEKRGAEEYTAIVGFAFSERADTLSGIIRNPFGFVVASWRSDRFYTGDQ